MLDNYPAFGTIDPAHEIDEEYLNVPDRNELEPSWFTGCVIPGCGLFATGADRMGIGAGKYLYFNLLLFEKISDFAIYK